MMNHDMTLENNIMMWRERVNAAAAKWGGCEVCAVTKTVDVETINRAYDAGLHVIGENRVQEWVEKHEKIDKSLKYHQIGRLQSNKIKYIIYHVDGEIICGGGKINGGRIPDDHYIAGVGIAAHGFNADAIRIRAKAENSLDTADHDGRGYAGHRMFGTDHVG